MVRPALVSVASTALVVSVVAAPSVAQASTRSSSPTITDVSTIVAQNDCTFGDACFVSNPYSSGAEVTINGSGFGSTPPTVAVAANDAVVGNSAIGMDTRTNNLEIEDVTRSSYMGLNTSHGWYDDCNVTIGSWSDTQITVLMDDTGGLDCYDIQAGDTFTFEVWSTDSHSDTGLYTDPNPAVAPGTLPDITGCSGNSPCPGYGLSPASGPTTGGTFNIDGTDNPNGTITISGTNLTGASLVWFGNGGNDGAVSAPPQSVSADGTSLTVVPPPSPAGYDEGLIVVVTTPAGTSVVPCAAIDEGCQGTFYYQSPSSLLGTIGGSTGALNYNGSLSESAAIPQSTSGCPGTAPLSGSSLTASVSASVSGGPVDFSGGLETSNNDGFLSSAQAPITVHVEKPVTMSLTLSGSVQGCFAIPIPDLNIPGIGGIYIVVGGNITATYTLTITLNAGTWIVDAGYVANQVSGATIVSQNCVDGSGNAAPCIQTASSASITGVLDVSPLWFGLNIDEPHFSLDAGAGLTVSAFVTASTSGNFDYDVCAGGTYAVNLSAGPINYASGGDWFGPFNIYGDGTQCPLGAIGAGLAPTTVAVVSSASPVAVNTPVTYTATVSGSDAGGTVSFSDNGSIIAACDAVAVQSDGTATCQQTYSSAETDSIVATYSGDAASVSSISPALSETVSGAAVAAPTTTTVTTSANPVGTGAAVTYTATVSGGATGGTVAFTDGGSAVSGCQSVALSATGTATCSTSYTVGGSHSIIATYSGTSAFLTSASTALVETVVAATTTTLSPISPVATGTAVTYTATVAPTATSGTVTFTDNGTDITSCINLPLAASRATCAQTYTTSGSHVIVASYSGATGLAASVSTADTEVVTSGSSTTVLSSSSSSIATSAIVTFSANVSPSTTGGTVSFTDNGTVIPTCAAVPVTTGLATCSDSFPSTGTHSIGATFSGDSDAGGSAASPITQTVTAASSTTRLASSANPAPVGSPVTFTATVSPSSIGGTVAFTDNSVAIPGCSAVAVASASSAATCTTTYGSAGTHTIGASFAGSSNLAPSTASTLSVTVSAGLTGTATTLTSSLNPATTGKTVTYRATVAPALSAGTVTFSDAGTPIVGCTGVSVAAGVATCAQTYTKAATHAITASYSGSGSDAASASALLTETVTAATTTTLTSSAPTAAVNTTVTYTAQIAPGVDGGTVTFTDGGSAISGCSALPVIIATSNVTCAQKYTGTASHTIAATYSGDALFAASSATALTEAVGGTFTTTKTLLTSSHNPGVVGTPVTYTATITPTVTAGTVSFTVNGVPLAGCQNETVAATGSTATCTVTYPSVGSVTIGAEYSGSGSFAPSSAATLGENIDAAPTFSSNVSPAVAPYGSSVRLTAIDLPVADTGTVTFSYDLGTLCSATISLGRASCTTPTTLAPRPYQVTATYTKTGLIARPLPTFTIVKAATSMTAAAAPAVDVYGTAVKLSVAKLPSLATGNVTFTSGSTSLCVGKAAKGVASCSTILKLAIGSYPVTATYAGDVNYLPTSAATSFVVNKAPVHITATATPTSAVYGKQVSLKATGFAVGTTGTVVFTSGSTTLCSNTFVGVTASCVTAKTLTPGTYPVTATYSGSGLYLPGTATTSFTVTKAAATITASAPASTVVGKAVPLSGHVLPAAATGTVTFSVKGVTLCSASIVAAYGKCSTPTTLAVGTYTATVAYSGNTLYLPATTTLTFAIAAAKQLGVHGLLAWMTTRGRLG